MPDIRVGTAVAELIGAERLRRLRADPPPFTCWHCGGPGGAEPASVIAETGPADEYTPRTTVIDGAVRVALAHADCSPSQVVTTDPAAADALLADRPDETVSWRTLLADLPGPEGFRPPLVLDVRPGMSGSEGPDPAVSRALAALRDRSLAPVTTIGEALALAVDDTTDGADAGSWLPARADG